MTVGFGVLLPFFVGAGTWEEGGGVRDGSSIGAGEISFERSMVSGWDSDCVRAVVADVD